MPQGLAYRWGSVTLLRWDYVCDCTLHSHRMSEDDEIRERKAWQQLCPFSIQRAGRLLHSGLQHFCMSNG